MSKGYLVLENGDIFEGELFGAQKDITGEVVFTTGMTGYIETLTDPSYYGQIVVQTFPMIGNYGIIPEDFESQKMGASAYIVNEWCQEPSNFRSQGELDTFLKEQGKTGIAGIDTRELTKRIREYGTMNGAITSDPNSFSIESLHQYRVVKPVSIVSTARGYEEIAEHERFKVVVIDCGLKGNIKKELVRRGCSISVLPYKTEYEQILQMEPDGVMLTNGPGDPKDNTEVIDTVYKLMQAQMPIFGICLGHQIMALANGFMTAKMKYGHRGANQPVKDLDTGKVYITSQNHGYAVIPDSVDSSKASIWFENVNDRTCEGIVYKNHPAFSVQFHPEACGGPKDTDMLFDKFMSLMERNRENAKK